MPGTRALPDAGPYPSSHRLTRGGGNGILDCCGRPPVASDSLLAAGLYSTVERAKICRSQHGEAAGCVRPRHRDHLFHGTVLLTNKISAADMRFFSMPWSW
jgi:hypothetical protein